MRPDVRFCRRERTRGYAPSRNRLYGRSRVTADELPGTADDLPSCSHRPRAGTRHPYYHALSAKTFRRCNRAGSGAPRDGPGPLRSGNVRAARAIRKTASRPALLLCERRREITAPGDIATQIRFARETLTTTPRPRRATPSSPASGPTAATASPRCPSARGLSSPLPVGVVDHRPPTAVSGIDRIVDRLDATSSPGVWHSYGCADRPPHVFIYLFYFFSRSSRGRWYYIVAAFDVFPTKRYTPLFVINRTCVNSKKRRSIFSCFKRFDVSRRTLTYILIKYTWDRWKHVA